MDTSNADRNGPVMLVTFQKHLPASHTLDTVERLLFHVLADLADVVVILTSRVAFADSGRPLSRITAAFVETDRVSTSTMTEPYRSCSAR